jgi:hypothetical protein
MRHFLENATGLEIYPILSFLLFIAFFVFVAVRVLTRSKKEILELSRIPLLNDDTQDDTKNRNDIKNDTKNENEK